MTWRTVLIIVMVAKVIGYSVLAYQVRQLRKLRARR